MSYVDALYDQAHDRIHVVERINGKRVYCECPAINGLCLIKNL